MPRTAEYMINANFFQHFYYCLINVHLNCSPRNEYKERRATLHSPKIQKHESISAVDSFDEQTIVAVTDCGELTIRGEKLHITKLSLEVGELCIEGKISALQYTDVTVKSGSFLSRVFR